MEQEHYCDAHFTGTYKVLVHLLRAGVRAEVAAESGKYHKKSAWNKGTVSNVH